MSDNFSVIQLSFHVLGGSFPARGYGSSFNRFLYLFKWYNLAGFIIHGHINAGTFAIMEHDPIKQLQQGAVCLILPAALIGKDYMDAHIFCPIKKHRDVTIGKLLFISIPSLR